MKRLKRRYLALKLDVAVAPTEREFIDAVWGAVTRLFGEFGASQASISLINYDQEHKFAVIRTNLNATNNVRAALVTITSFLGRGAAVHVLAVSGTIKALYRRLSS
jgi:RNase P/RNase MRP subunit POP5